MSMFHSFKEREKREKEAAAAHAQQSKPAAWQQRTSRIKNQKSTQVGQMKYIGFGGVLCVRVSLLEEFSRVYVF
jgi:hypothetical protein